MTLELVLRDYLQDYVFITKAPRHEVKPYFQVHANGKFDAEARRRGGAEQVKINGKLLSQREKLALKQRVSFVSRGLEEGCSWPLIRPAATFSLGEKRKQPRLADPGAIQQPWGYTTA